MPTAYISHPVFLKHQMEPFHPEQPQRLQAIEDALIAQGLMDWLRYYEAPRATEAQLLRVHSREYLGSLAELSPEQGLVHLDGDTALNPYTLEAAWHAAGAVVLATDLVMTREVDTAFCAIRPPGHHAERAKAMGFCFFNNVAVGVAHALEQHGLQRVAIVDFDVHHGNGTEKIFREDPRVLLCSTYQHPFYPYTEVDFSQPNVIHAPLDAGSGSAEFRQAVLERWMPALQAFKPQFIFVSAGFDGHVEDDMGQLNLMDADYAWVTSEVMEVAGKYAEGRVVSALEGGYELNALGRSVQMHIRGLMGVQQNNWRGKPYA